MPVFIIIMSVAVVALLTYSYRIYRADKKKRNAVPEQCEIQKTEEPEEVQELQEPQESQELVNLVDYYRDPGKQLVSSTEEDAEYDVLCDVVVGQAFINQGQSILNEAMGNDEIWAVFSVDIDRFRFINTLRGVSLGDYAITHLMQEMETILPERAIISRKSADHFVALFPIIGPNDLESYCERLRRGVDRIRGDIGAKSGLHLCIGVALSGDEGYDFDLLLAKSNIARHCMKISKNENYGLYDESMVTSFLYGESAVDDYTDNQYGDELILYFQPQTDVSKNIIVASQVLVRWACVDANVKDMYVTPENGKIPTNGRKVLYQSCREISRWRKSGKEVLPVFIYMPTQDFLLKDIDGLLVKCMEEFQIDPSLLVPVIESSAIRINPEIAKIQLKKFADIGIRVAVDAITATVPRFEFLEGLHLCYVKVPRGFTSNIERKPEREKFIKQIHAAISSLPLTPIYEGVDDVARTNIIRNIGGLLAEGRYAGRSVVSEDFSRILQEYVQKRKQYNATLILDDEEFLNGEYKL